MSELRRNVRIEEKRGNFNAIISNDQWPTGDYAMSEMRGKCRNLGANVGIEEQRGHCYLH